MSHFPGWKPKHSRGAVALIPFVVRSVEFKQNDHGVWFVEIVIWHPGHPEAIILQLTIEEARDADIIQEVT